MFSPYHHLRKGLCTYTDIKMYYNSMYAVNALLYQYNIMLYLLIFPAELGYWVLNQMIGEKAVSFIYIYNIIIIVELLY